MPQRSAAGQSGQACAKVGYGHQHYSFPNDLPGMMRRLCALWAVACVGCIGDDENGGGGGSSGSGGGDTGPRATGVPSTWGADLTGADLTGANLRRAYLAGADLRNARLTGADLQGAVYDDDTKWPEGFDCHAAGVVLLGSEQSI